MRSPTNRNRKAKIAAKHNILSGIRARSLDGRVNLDTHHVFGIRGKTIRDISTEFQARSPLQFWSVEITARIVVGYCVTNQTSRKFRSYDSASEGTWITLSQACYKAVLLRLSFLVIGKKAPVTPVRFALGVWKTRSCANQMNYLCDRYRPQ